MTHSRHCVPIVLPGRYRTRDGGIVLMHEAAHTTRPDDDHPLLSGTIVEHHAVHGSDDWYAGGNYYGGRFHGLDLVEFLGTTPAPAAAPAPTTGGFAPGSYSTTVIAVVVIR